MEGDGILTIAELRRKLSRGSIYQLLSASPVIGKGPILGRRKVVKQSVGQMVTEIDDGRQSCLEWKGVKATEKDDGTIDILVPAGVTLNIRIEGDSV